MASKLVFWKPIIKKKKRKTSISPSIIDALMNDTGMENVMELKTAMLDRDGRQRRV